VGSTASRREIPYQLYIRQAFEAALRGRVGQVDIQKVK
jgi:predicted DNA binding CopG/RHH family protein